MEYRASIVKVQEPSKRITPFGFIEDYYRIQILIAGTMLLVYGIWNYSQICSNLNLVTVRDFVKNMALAVPVALVATSMVFDVSITISEICRFIWRLLRKMLSSIIRDYRERYERNLAGKERYKGEARKQAEWEDWNNERLSAEERGEDFNKPPPSPPIIPED